MLFKFEYTVHDLGLKAGQSVTFKDEGDESVELQLFRPDAVTEGLPHNGCIATAIVNGRITDKVAAQLARATEELKQYSELHDGNQRPPSIPNAVTQMSQRIGGRATEYVRRVTKLLRWKVGIPSSHHNPIHSGRDTTWSDDGTTWNLLPGGIRMSLLWSGGFKFPDDALFDAAKEMLVAGEAEPLGHELLREALTIQNDNPRSSLLIGVTAAEVGLKSFIGKMIPHAEWLAMHVPSPPLVLMLQEYLPMLPIPLVVDGRPIVPFVPTPMLDSLRKAVKLRNEATHAGGTVKLDTLRGILETIHDLLYLLDVYAGHRWAFEHIHFHQESISEGFAKQKQRK
jgi:hypothetical protein